MGLYAPGIGVVSGTDPITVDILKFTGSVAVSQSDDTMVVMVSGGLGPGNGSGVKYATFPLDDGWIQNIISATTDATSSLWMVNDGAPPFYSGLTWWRDVSEVWKVRQEENIVGGNIFPTVQRFTYYDLDHGDIARFHDEITYVNNVFESTRLRYWDGFLSPQIYSVSPTSTIAGATATLSGNMFMPTSAVWIHKSGNLLSGALATVVSRSMNNITFIVPSVLGNASITVYNTSKYYDTLDDSFFITPEFLAVDVLAVGAGGGGNGWAPGYGSAWGGSGGGGGQVKSGSAVLYYLDSNSLVVGLGSTGSTGGGSSFSGIIGSGGGAAGLGTTTAGSGGISGDGFAGGTGGTQTYGNGGGGASVTGTGGGGGDGKLWAFNGQYYGGGGGAGQFSNGAGIGGGVGGGGTGAARGDFQVEAGAPGEYGRGGGGGGGVQTGASAGGTGIVVVVYPGLDVWLTGGFVTTDGNNTIHSFYTGSTVRFANRIFEPSGPIVPDTASQLTNVYFDISGNLHDTKNRTWGSTGTLSVGPYYTQGSYGGSLTASAGYLFSTDNQLAPTGNFMATIALYLDGNEYVGSDNIPWAMTSGGVEKDWLDIGWSGNQHYAMQGQFGPNVTNQFKTGTMDAISWGRSGSTAYLKIGTNTTVTSVTGTHVPVDRVQLGAGIFGNGFTGRIYGFWLSSEPFTEAAASGNNVAARNFLKV